MEVIKLFDTERLEKLAHQKAKARYRYEAHHALRKDQLTERELEVARTSPIGEIVKVPRSNHILCPFHKEKTPSCHITKSLYFCFGCGAGGDAISFVQKSKRLSFVEAVRWLNQQ